MSQNIIKKLGCQANGGARTGRTPPRSANELGCQANGGRAPGAPPLDPPMQSQLLYHILRKFSKLNEG